MRGHRKRILLVAGAIAGLFSCVAPAGAAPAEPALTWFTDGADDAYRLQPIDQPPPQQPPNPILSNPTADILQAGYATVSRHGKNHTYRVTMRITGTPSPAYNYVVAAAFGSDCWLYHFLTPGTTGGANAICYRSGTNQSVGSLRATGVEVDGHVVRATFKVNRATMPAALAANPELVQHFAFSCVSGLEGRGCTPEEKLDTAADGSASTFDL